MRQSVNETLEERVRMNGEPIEDVTDHADGWPSFLRRSVAAIRGYPTGRIIDKDFTPEHWAEGTVNTYGDNAGPLAMAGMLPDRSVLVIHSAEHEPCAWSHDDYTVKHVEYDSVTGTTFGRLDIGDIVRGRPDHRP